MLLTFLLCLTVGFEYDPYGALYEDSTFSRLILVPSFLKNYSFPASVVSVAGGSSQTSAFSQCRDVIKNITFPVGSQLASLDSYAFYKCAFDSIIDLSNCEKLLKLSFASFNSCKSMKGIILPPNIIEIQSGALGTCQSITSIEFPSSLKVLGGYSEEAGSSLANCFALREIKWKENSLLRVFGSNCFIHCNLSKLFIPRFTESINTGAFLYNPITEITIDPQNANFKTDNKAIFSSNQKSILCFAPGFTGSYHISNKVEVLEAQCFATSKLSIINISSSVREISYQVFYQASIAHITIPNTVTVLGSRTLNGCSNLEYVEFYPNITIISEYMFADCPILKEVIIPGSVKELRKSVFENCKSLNHIFLPKSIETIGGSCFTGINKDCFIEFENGSKLYVENETIFNYNMNEVIAYIGSNKNFDLIIPNTVRIVKSRAFMGVSLKSLSFQDKSVVTEIEESAFEGCNLNTIKLPPELISLGKGCFKSNPNLSKIDFDESKKIRSIGEGSFQECSIRTLKLPSTIEEILQLAFFNCRELNSVTFSGESLKTLDTQCFYGTKIDNFIVPSSIDYLGSQIFGESLHSVVFYASTSTTLTNLKIIGDSSFKNCLNLNYVQFAEGIISIGRNSFEGCISLEKIKLCGSIETISLQAFKKCSNLKMVGIPDESHLNSIEGFAFDECYNLAEFEITDNNKNFKADEGALYNFDVTRIILYLPGSKRKNFTTPCSIEKIDAYSFQRAKNLEVIDMRNSSITTIGNSAFYGCSSLCLVYLPHSLGRVDGLAFAECTGLGCGSIIFEYDETLYQMLLKSSAPAESLSPCSTMVFTGSGEAALISLIDASLAEVSISEGG